MEKIIKIEEMMCDNCVARVKKALEGTNGVSNADVSLADKQAVVTFDDAVVSLDALYEAVEATGFDVVK